MRSFLFSEHEFNHTNQWSLGALDIQGPTVASDSMLVRTSLAIAGADPRMFDRGFLSIFPKM